MKKSFKFGELKNYQELLIKIIGLLLFAGIIFYAVKIITSQIAKILGAGAAAAGSVANGFSACFDCKNQTDSNGKLKDPKKACPPNGKPFANEDCGGFMGFSAAALLAALGFLFGLIGIRGFWKSKLAETAEIHGNISNKDLVEITKPAIDKFDADIKERGDDIAESYRDAQERAQVEAKLGPAPDSVKTKEEFDKWVQDKGSDAVKTQSDIREIVNKTYPNDVVFDTLREIKVKNTIVQSAPPTTTSAQKAQMDNQFKADTAAQGAAEATKVGLEEDAARSVAEQASEAGKDKDQADVKPFEESCRP